MNLQSVKRMMEKPGVIPEIPAGVIKSRIEVKQERRDIIYNELIKSPNIRQTNLIKICVALGVGDMTTIRRDITTLIEAGRVKKTTESNVRGFSFELIAL